MRYPKIDLDNHETWERADGAFRALQEELCADEHERSVWDWASDWISDALCAAAGNLNDVMREAGDAARDLADSMFEGDDERSYWEERGGKEGCADEMHNAIVHYVECLVKEGGDEGKRL